MIEYVKKADVLEIMNAPLPRDIAWDYIYDLKGVWLDEDEIDTSQTENADRPQEWIPCSERLPDDNREVLISLEWGIDIGTYERGEWRSEWINHYDDDNVLAWMPLPKPWEGADDEFWE